MGTDLGHFEKRTFFQKMRPLTALRLEADVLQHAVYFRPQLAILYQVLLSAFQTDIKGIRF
jgi:hypothetical protein